MSSNLDLSERFSDAGTGCLAKPAYAVVLVPSTERVGKDNAK